MCVYVSICVCAIVEMWSSVDDSQDLVPCQACSAGSFTHWVSSPAPVAIFELFFLFFIEKLFLYLGLSLQELTMETRLISNSDRCATPCLKLYL